MNASRADVELLYKACEAFWRDVKYAVMARNYRLVKELSRELQKAGVDARDLRHPSPLFDWVLHVKAVETCSVTAPALRNTVFHLLGYWKRDLSQAQRQRLSDRAMTDAAEVLSELKTRLGEIDNPYLETSYIWSDSPWERAVFQANGRQWCLKIAADGDVEILPVVDQLPRLEVDCS